MRTRLLASVAAVAAFLLGSVANATTSHHTIHGAITAIIPYSSPSGSAVTIPSIFSEGTSCTMSFDYTPDGAVNVSSSSYVGVFEHAFSNLQISFGANTYVGTATSATAQVINAVNDLTEDLFYITGPLVGADFPTIEGYNFTSGNDGFLYMMDGTRAAFSDNTLPANISNLFFTDTKPALTELQFIDASGNRFIVRAAFGSQDIQPPSTYFGLGASYSDNVFEAMHLYMGANFYDPIYAGPITSITLTYPDGTAVGSKEGGYSGIFGVGTPSYGAYAGDLFARRRDVPNGAYEITVYGGIRDGLRLTYNLDRALVPLAMPRFICASEFALEHARADRPITVFFWPFLDRQPSAKPNVVLGIYKLGDGESSPSETPIFNVLEIDPNAICVTIPANTLSAGSFILSLVHEQTGPASKDGLTATYGTSNTISFTRKR